jgi:hypothetical protein
MANPIGKKRNRYRKLPLKTKVIFLKRVLEEGHSIKKVIVKQLRFLQVSKLITLQPKL